MREIGRLLSVGAVLDGSVRRAGDRLRVTAQLMSAETGLQLWSETYDGGMEDVFGIQDRISIDIARALRVKLVSGASRIAHARVTNMACYNLYLKGLHYAAKATSEGYQTALEAFSAALREDETFAKAHIGIAEIYIWLGFFTVLPPALVFPKAKEHAERALEIDDTLAEGWNILANVSYNYDWDWAAAERYFQRALELNPKLVATLYSYSVFQQNMGRHAESVANAKLAADLSPLSPVVQSNVGWRQYWAGDVDAAIESWKGVVELQPDFPIALLGLVSAYRDQGRFAEITAEMERHLAERRSDHDRRARSPLRDHGSYRRRPPHAGGARAPLRHRVRRALQLGVHPPRPRRPRPRARAAAGGGARPRESALRPHRSSLRLPARGSPLPRAGEGDRASLPRHRLFELRCGAGAALRKRIMKAGAP